MRKKVSGEFNILTLFLGLLLGFFLGSSAVYWHYNRQNGRFLMEMINHVASLFKENSTNSSTSELASGHKTTNLNNHPKIATAVESEKPYTEMIAERYVGGGTTDSINETADNSQVIRGGNTYSTDEQTSNAQSEKTDEPSGMHSIYSIAQDRLLYTMSVVLPGTNDSRSKSERVLDSLLGSTTISTTEQIFFLEFWESPLNLLGYRKGKNKIVFYGIRLYDFASITSYQGKIYLRYLNNYYPLETTTSFKPLIPLIDPYLDDLMQ